MIRESLIILFFVLLLSYVFNKKIRAMTIRRPMRPDTRTRSSGSTPPPTLGESDSRSSTTLPPPPEHNTEYIDKISKTDPKAVAALITYLAKDDKS